MMKKHLTTIIALCNPSQIRPTNHQLTVGMYIGLTGVITFSLEVPNIDINRVGSDQMWLFLWNFLS